MPKYIADNSIERLIGIGSAATETTGPMLRDALIAYLKRDGFSARA
jgi:hypothetical protein